jgi:hypothetical protein
MKSGQDFRGFANVFWPVKGTGIPDDTSFPHLIAICSRVYFALCILKNNLEICGSENMNKKVQYFDENLMKILKP